MFTRSTGCALLFPCPFSLLTNQAGFAAGLPQIVLKLSIGAIFADGLSPTVRVLTLAALAARRQTPTPVEPPFARVARRRRVLPAHRVHAAVWPHPPVVAPFVVQGAAVVAKGAVLATDTAFVGARARVAGAPGLVAVGAGTSGVALPVARAGVLACRACAARRATFERHELPGFTHGARGGTVEITSVVAGAAFVAGGGPVRVRPLFVPFPTHPRFSVHLQATVPRVGYTQVNVVSVVRGSVVGPFAR